MAKPSALILDAWLGKEAIQYFPEQDLKEILRRHMLSGKPEVDRIEAIGSTNFLTIDDLPIEQEGVPLDSASIVRLPTKEGIPQFPDFGESTNDEFLRKVEASAMRFFGISRPIPTASVIVRLSFATELNGWVT